VLNDGDVDPYVLPMDPPISPTPVAKPTPRPFASDADTITVPLGDPDPKLLAVEPGEDIDSS
jgi:hypothetical protein